MRRGLKLILSRIREQPSPILAHRYLMLVAELPDEREKFERTLDLAEELCELRPKEALRLALIAHRAYRDEVRPLDLMIAVMEQRGKTERVRVLTEERAKLLKKKELANKNFKEAEPKRGEFHSRADAESRLMEVAMLDLWEQEIGVAHEPSKTNAGEHLRGEKPLKIEVAEESLPSMRSAEQHTVVHEVQKTQLSPKLIQGLYGKSPGDTILGIKMNSNPPQSPRPKMRSKPKMQRERTEIKSLQGGGQAPRRVPQKTQGNKPWDHFLSPSEKDLFPENNGFLKGESTAQGIATTSPPLEYARLARDERQLEQWTSSRMLHLTLEDEVEPSQNKDFSKGANEASGAGTQSEAEGLPLAHSTDAKGRSRGELVSMAHLEVQGLDAFLSQLLSKMLAMPLETRGPAHWGLLQSLWGQKPDQHLVQLLRQTGLTRHTLAYWIFYLKGLIATSAYREALVEIRSVLKVQKQLPWSEAAYALLPQIWTGLGVRGFLWEPESGTKSLLDKLLLPAPPTLVSMVQSGGYEIVELVLAD